MIDAKSENKPIGERLETLPWWIDVVEQARVCEGARARDGHIMGMMPVQFRSVPCGSQHSRAPMAGGGGRTQESRGRAMPHLALDPK